VTEPDWAKAMVQGFLARKRLELLIDEAEDRLLLLNVQSFVQKEVERRALAQPANYLLRDDT
jgi:hypothetical protein